MSLPPSLIPHLPALRASAELGNQHAIRTLQLAQRWDDKKEIDLSLNEAVIASLTSWLKVEEERTK